MKSVRSMASTNGAVSGIADTNFIPPTLTFRTASPGGWPGPNTPWIQIGNNSYPDGNPAACPSGTPYAAIVLNRATLQDADPNTPITCVQSTAVESFLGAIPSDELVIFGTLPGQNVQTSSNGSDPLNPNPQFNTSGIGGTMHAQSDTAHFPLGYLIIGAGHATAGSAYENYYASTDYLPPSGNYYAAFANGMLVEDINGNYNYQPAIAAEFSVNPSDKSLPAWSQGAITASFSNVPFSGSTLVYYDPPGDTNGYWLLKLDRNNLTTDPGCSASQGNYYPCGHFYNTGSSDAATAVKDITSLVAELNLLPRNELVVLVGVGMPIYGGTTDWDAAEKTYPNLNPYYQNLATALENLGGVPMSTLKLNSQTSVYTLVSCKDCGNSVTGNVSLSSTVFSQQGQTGYIHGLLGQNLNGLYWPVRTSQETAGSGVSADYTLDYLLSQQPVAWPELSTLLPNASTVQGQVAAYHYISYQLITQYYIKGASGNYLDDIHYYFTGSNNTLIDYHTFDPVNMAFPGTPNTGYTWTDPVTNSAMSFTPQDFSAVASQMSTEVVDLVNVLQFMVTGSTNLKDIVAAGNGSAALAMINAASAVEASNLRPAPATPAKLNVSNILNMVGNVVNLGVSLASGGLIPPGLVDDVSKANSIFGALIGGASTAAGGFYTPGTSALPSPQFQFTTTIANLSDSALQMQYSVGFDSQLDSILANWGSLSVLGPQVTNTSNRTFYSPNQVAQNTAIRALGQASQRNYYLAVMPSFYQVHYYPSWWGKRTQINVPDMGTVNDDHSCNKWYDYTDPFTYAGQGYPTFAGSPNPWYNFQFNGGIPNPVDWYLIAGNPQNASKTGSSGQRFDFIDSQVADTLFGSDGLNLVFDEVVDQNGPLNSVFLNAITSGFDGFNEKYVDSCTNGEGATATGGTPDPYKTTIAMDAPATAVLGETASFAITVKAGTGTPAGKVDIQEGRTVLASGTLDSKGSASLTINSLGLGAHALAAYFYNGGDYSSSNTPEKTVTVYASDPDMVLALSTGSLQISYGTTSSPVTMQVTPRYGMTGSVTFSCTGLPIGMNCNFNPAQASFGTSGMASTSLTITSAATQKAGMLWSNGVGILFLPFSLLCLWKINKEGRRMKSLLFLLVLSIVSLGSVMGCGGSDSSKPTQETGAKTILVSATSGSVTRTTPLVLNIQ